MNLTFDNLQELDDFLIWVRDTGKELTAPRESINSTRSTTYTTRAPGAATTIGTLVGLAGAGASGSAGVAFDTPPDTRMPPPVTGDPSGAALEPADGPEPAKRKRRTKAEIEAAAAAEARADEAAALAAAAELTAYHTDKGPVVSGEAQPGGANPFEQVATAGDGAATGEGDEKAGNEPEVVTPFQHLTRAREFIAKHGMPKYNESFAKAGLDANVMGYSAYQRGLHMDALDALEKA